MKKYFALLVGLFCAGYLFSQEKQDEEFKTLFNKIENHGGFGAFTVNYSEIKLAKGNIREAAVVGGKGEWIANHNFGLGIGGYGIISGSFNNHELNKKVMLNIGYGGIIAEAIFFPKKLLHLTVPVLIGAGGATLMESYNEQHNYNDNFANYTLDQDQFFILEPGVELEINIVKHLRIALGGYYRLTTGIKISEINENALDGFSGGISFKVGSF